MSSDRVGQTEGGERGEQLANLCVGDPGPRSDTPTVRVGPSAIHGRGLFATTSFEPGNVIGRLEGVLTTNDSTYVLWVTDDLGLEIVNDFRFINHSDTPNCVLSMSEVTAVRPIAPGDELTYDYSGG